MADELTFSIGIDGDVTVRSYEQLERWIEKERSNWTWLQPGDRRTDRHNVANLIQQGWDGITSSLVALRNQGQPLENMRPHLAPLASGPLLVSSTRDGATVLDVLHDHGDLAASFSAGFITGQVTLQQAQNRDDLLGAMLTVIPDISKVADWTEHLKRERNNFKNATRSLIERVDREADERTQSVARLVERASVIAKRFFDGKRERWRTVEGNWLRGASDAVADIRATEAAYKEYMKLKAPVEYWDGKATEHRTREAEARTRLYIYFPVTLAIMVGAFVWVADFLISHPDTTTSKAPVALYVVVSGGLILLSSIAFWIGRILTKLYLSEHHLRNDAEERAVMTTTYLALTNEGSATDTDRQIVLNALFRATPDGIVKDDGPSDASLQGLIARLITK